MNENIINLIIQAKNLSSNALNQVKGQLADLSKHSEKTGNIMAGMGDNFKKAVSAVAIGAGIMGGAIAGISVVGFNTAASFQTQMSSISALTGATARDMDEVRKVALKAGEETAFSALEAAQGLEELLKSGLNIEQAKTGLKGALDLAAAGGVSVADAAEIASTALNAFKNDSLSVAQASDILAGAANASATSVGELKLGLSAVSAVAAGVGMSFKDTNTALALFAQNGLKGSDAGTSLKTMFLNLQPTTKAQIGLFAELGLTTTKTTTIFEENTKATGKNAEKIQELRQKIEELTSKGLEKSGVAVNKNNEALNKYRTQIAGLQDKIDVLKTKQGEWNEKTKESTKLTNQNQIEKYTSQIGNLSSKIQEVSKSSVSLDVLPKDTQEKISKLKEQIQGLGGVVGKTKDVTVETGNAFFTAEGKVKSLAEISGVLKNALKDQTDQQRLASLEVLFGSDAIRAANILYKEGADGVNNMAGAMSKFTAADVAKEKLNNFNGVLDAFKGSLETKQIEIFSKALPFATDAIKLMDEALKKIDVEAVFTDLGNKFNYLKTQLETAKKWVDDNKTAIETLAVILGSFAIAWGIVSGAIAIYNGAIALGTTLTTAYGAAVVFLTGPFGLAVLAIGALIAIGYLLYKNWDLIKATAFAVSSAVAGWFAQKWKEIGNWFNWLGNLAIQKWNEMIAGVNALTSGITNFFGNMINGIVNGFNNLDMWQIGSNIMTGLGNGLWAMVDRAMGPINWLMKQVDAVLGKQSQAQNNANSQSTYDFGTARSGKGNAWAKGGAFQNGNVVAFADGGVVNRPTNFAMSGGRLGLMGEAGAEAIMPLSRGKDGKLGVKAEGGGSTVIINNPVFLSGDENVARQFVKSIEDQLFKSFQKFSKI
jgi:TP901 family phage tail tape measure protein